MKKRLFFLLGAMIMIAGGAFIGVPLVRAEESPVKADIKTRMINESDVDKMAGNLEVVESGFGVSYESKMLDPLPLTLSFDYQRVDMDNDGIPVDLPSHMQGWSVGIGTKFPVPLMESDQHYLGVDVYPSMYTEDLKWDSGAFRIPVRLYWIYKYSEDLLFIAGATVRGGYDTPVLPIIGFNYKASDRLNFNLASSEPNVTYKLDDRTTALVEFDGKMEEYEVAHETDRSVILKYRSASAGVGIKYATCPYSELLLSFGGVFGRQLKYEDDSAKVEPDAGLYGKIKFSLKF